MLNQMSRYGREYLYVLYLINIIKFDGEEMVTVVITTCNRNPDIVERAIRSVIEQTYKDWELIVIDDSPCEYSRRDDVREMIIRYSLDYRIIYIQNERNSGACYSRNVGLNSAGGKYIAFLDDDDEWVTDKIQKQVNALEQENEDVALVYCRFYRMIDELNQKVIVDLPLYKGNLYDRLMAEGNFIGGMSMPLMKTQCVKSVGGFDEKMQSLQDMDLWLRIAQKFKITSIEDPLIIYHVHGVGQISFNPCKKIAGINGLIEKNNIYLRKHKHSMWRLKQSLINHYLTLGDTRKAFAIWKEVVLIIPYRVIPNIIELIKIITYRVRKREKISEDPKTH